MRAYYISRRGERAEDDTLRDYRASTDDAIEQLISARPVLGPQEKAYLERTLKLTSTSSGATYCIWVLSLFLR